MVRGIAIFVASLFLGMVPAVALAETSASNQLQIQHLATIVAALEAQEAALSGGPIACAAITSKTSVHVGEQFVLAWGSVGALNPGDDPSKPMWTPNGASTIALEQLGTWTYYFTFYGANGASTTCTAIVVVGA
jgi:hypothetical protein